MALARPEESTKQALSRIDTAIDQLECYANLLEAIKAMNGGEEAKALKAMLSVSKGLAAMKK